MQRRYRAVGANLICNQSFRKNTQDSCRFGDHGRFPCCVLSFI